MVVAGLARLDMAESARYEAGNLDLSTAATHQALVVGDHRSASESSAAVATPSVTRGKRYS
jgi:hypothetical protein